MCVMHYVSMAACLHCWLLQKEYNALLKQYHEIQTKFEEGQELLPDMEVKIEGLEEEKRELEVGWFHTIN